MIGILIQLALSWLLLWFLEKKNLSVLGFYPSKTRLTGFLLFFFLTAFFSALGFFFRMGFAEQRWELNPALSAKLLLTGFWWNVKSVLFEELIFRGALLYILIKKLGTGKAILISSVAFGIYHWFSHEVTGDPVQMIITFLTTGIMGLIYAYGYAKTFSLYIPCAIHLGWNLVQSWVFSGTVIGQQLLAQVQPVPEVTISYFQYFLIVYLPILSFWVVSYLLLRKQKQAQA